MISFDDAVTLVLQHEKSFGTEKVSLFESTGRMLAQDVIADRDFPPYNRVMMDGIAIRSNVYDAGIRTFPIEKIQAAGALQQRLEFDENCIEVMTGAVLPANTDTVIPYEKCDITKGAATVKVEQVTKMQHVHLQGMDSRQGALLLPGLERLTPAMIGIMASVGLAEVEVMRLPKVAICSTGDELVAVSQQPEAHQVRRSNVYMLGSALASEGIHADTFHLPDNAAVMKAEIERMVNDKDVILFSGAVSKGKFDYLPAVLEQLGMKLIFHTIAQRPGKPFLFGKFANGTLVFGFPGNPASTFVCYHQFFKKWLQKSLQYQQPKQFAVLAVDVHFKPALSCHLLVTVENINGTTFATPVISSTSGDLVTLAKASGIIVLPAEREYFTQGEVFELNNVS
ncbi:MAG: molybdopterin molybdotransferase MoeA [Bacteroidota bacterium]|nr:molybdopterin molybdotransferase MoeA [Bacteroidota bacterium]